MPRLGKEQETLLTSFPFPLFNASYLTLFISVLVLDTRVWLKGLSLIRGLESDHLW